MAKYLVRTLSFGVLILLTPSCDETLPPRENIAKAFESSLRADYFVSQSENAIKIVITVKNVFDESFQDQAVLKGTMEITLDRMPEIKKTMRLSSADLISAPGYDRTAGILTLDPGKSFTMGFSWDLKSDSSISLPDSVFHYYVDLGCVGRLIAYEESITIRGDLMIYKQAPLEVLHPIRFRFCYVNRWVRPGACPLVDCKPR